MKNHSLSRGISSSLMAACACILLAAGCSSPPPVPLRTVSNVEIPRFMGSWYVIANIPPFIEEGAHNSVETYRLDPDGSIDTTFRYRADGFDGKQKELKSRAFVMDRVSNAVWEVEFFKFIRADYRVIHVDAAYTETIIGRDKRDYLWIMTRNPRVSEADYQRLAALAVSQGYDITRIQKVPQKWD
jgi:apolipoprotein D and lipocalin family protein